ncbi:isopentenyl-diphosphate Delta-isomerase [Corynebacterium epidermidicanis]|uniref:Isopentenyl-diphosphate Delta-isomerase n=1 Tax=Corynebacterium epidermidicanis TaxID=1050174 RepID=A0A0G3GXW0_9CORY|nr:isopentenyl-diphosphate Delta-isomerase [Corynebacterium epidermidicanis]AKK03647.1 isopentenyl-diphosphate delta-isomerase [Corynebacterium epidermidicanis]
MTTTPELVVLADQHGNPIGTAPKSTVHTTNTPYHLAFSCYVHNAAGEILLTRRALSKLTWPGVWTNSVCGHPGPGESYVDTVQRRGREELGATLVDISEVLPDFSYRAIDSSGIVEWEACPVFSALLDGELHPNPQEVDSFAWVSAQQLCAAVDATPFAFSPWLVEQLSHERLRQALHCS